MERRGVRRAIAIAGAVAVIGAIGLLATRPTVRALIASFVSPLPLASAPGASTDVPLALPAETAVTGSESRELAKLAASKDPQPARGARLAMFPTTARPAPVPERITALRRPEIIDRDDARIDEMMNYWLRDGRAHAALLAVYQRSGRYRSAVEQILGAWKVPELLSTMIFLESGFSPRAVQPDGGAGLWSLPLDVAQAYGLAVRDNYDERRAVASSTEVAGRYLADLKERFGSWALAIYAFAHGYKKTADDLAQTRARRFEDLADARTSADTAYVFQTFALATIMENPERFGLDLVHPDPPLATSDMEVPSEAPLAVIAQAAGTSLLRLRELNPEYLGDTVPTTGSAMIVHLPSDALARAKELLTPLLYAAPGTLSAQVGHVDEVDAAARAKPERAAKVDSNTGKGGTAAPRPGESAFYHVNEGETLDAIATRFGLTREAIASANSLDVTAPLRSGQLLLIRTPDAYP